MKKRFMMRLDPAWRPLLWVLGGAEPASFVETDEETVRFKFGYAFDRVVPRSAIIGADARDWPWWMGIGWRSNLRGVIGLIGSRRGVVEVRLKEQTRAWRVFPCDRIAVSLQDPEQFLEEINSGGESTTGRAAVQSREPATAAPRRTRKTTAGTSRTAKPSGTNGAAAPRRPSTPKRRQGRKKAS